MKKSKDVLIYRPILENVAEAMIISSLLMNNHHELRAHQKIISRWNLIKVFCKSKSGWKQNRLILRKTTFD
jgi:hypothetical protein